MKLRPIVGTVCVGLAAALAAGACSADSASKELDADGDLVADDLGDWISAEFDVNGDGKNNGVGVDTNGDGIADAAGLDTDGDGIVDALDFDGDGIPDKRTTRKSKEDRDDDGPKVVLGSGGNGTVGPGSDDDPKTCAEAQSARSYIGCEFWPTITYNPLFSEFDFAVVLANGGTEDANVTVSGGGLTADVVEVVPAGDLKTIILPWVAALKGPEFSRTNTANGRVEASVIAAKGAYRVVSDRPVTAWQFNPLQYKKPGADVPNCGTSFGTPDCYSVSNDASLLVPSSAMTGNYRVYSRSEIQSVSGGFNSTPSGIAITATQDGTNVRVEYGPNCNTGMMAGCSAAGGGVMASAAGEQVAFNLSAGDVVQILGRPGGFDADAHADISGSLIAADKPVQVIGFNPITNVPSSLVANADHIEELILPGEVIGNEYFVAPPTSPSGAVKGGHMVRIFGNKDGTTLTYDTKPAGAPDSINAGQVVEIGPLTTSFRVNGSESFAVSSVMLGGQSQGEGNCPNFPCSGDPAMSMMVTPEQFRTRYTFLAPADYDVNFADILVPDGATVTVDGAAVAGGEPIGATGWSVVRHLLDNGTGGSHRLESNVPVGLQVMGFGHATSYYYPGGLNLKKISEPVAIPPPR